MAKELQPLKYPRNPPHPLLEHRLAAARNGWSQNPCGAKNKLFTGWNRIACDEEAILNLSEWRSTRDRSVGTGVRVVGQLCVYDSDVNISEIADEILADLESLNAEAYANTIIRDSGGVTLAVFFRTLVPFGHHHTRNYTAHPELIPIWHAAKTDLMEALALPVESEEEETAKTAYIEECKTLVREAKDALNPQKIEIFGPLSQARFFQYEGPHSPGRVYRCWEQAPWNTRVDALPLLPFEPGPLIDRADAILKSRLVEMPEPPDTKGPVVYDLTPNTLFYTKNDPGERLEDLVDGIGGVGPEYCIRGCIESSLAGSKSESNCTLFITSGGRVMITDWSDNGRKHFLKSDEPPPRVEILQPPPDFPGGPAASTGLGLDGEIIEPGARQLRTRDAIRRGRTDQETHDNAVAWMLENVAYYPEAFRGRGGAVSIYPNGEFRVPLSIASLRGAMASFGWIEEGERGGQHFRNPVGAWSVHADQVIVHGIRMRPELDCPAFVEDGLKLINRYQAVFHPTRGGEIKSFFKRLETLIPDRIEREWFLNWLVWKVQNPQCRGVAVAMVARDNGAGRGLLAETMQLLFGEQFVVSIPYANISGGAKFNAEVEGRLLLYVNESAPPDGHKFHHRNATREALKVFIEPNHRIPFRVEPKGVDAYYTRAAVSTLVFTNNIDGLPLDEADRRIAVIINGPQMTVEERDQFQQGWMLKPENIGALYRHLRDRKVEVNRDVFDPYMAPHFHGRDLMIDAGKTLIDHAWDKAVEKLESGAELYAMSQVVALARHLARRPSHSDFDDLIEKHTVTHGYRIGVKHSKNWLIRYGNAEDNRERVYAFSEKGRRRWTHAEPHDIKAQLDKAQQVVDEPTRRFNKALHLAGTGTTSH